MPYTEKEKEYILFFEAKKQYYMANKNLTTKLLCEDDTITIDKMSNKDSLFVKYLNTKLGNKLTFTVQDKCLNLLGNNYINKKFDELNASRRDIFKAFFKEIDGNKRVKIKPIKNNIPFNGFSYYKIDYKGEIPKSLKKAYQRINEFNNEPPRNKFKKIRAKNTNTN